ncbi:hypothetical protein J4207_06595 [Candidatus Woesearchaeota archaeon]|nr:hypothetical protein [Candidatus Woesearchaeota archaeon]
MQRKIYNADYLQRTSKQETPRLVGIQQNGRYAAFYRRKEGYLRIIFTMNKELEIITFYFVEKLP